MHFSPFAVLAVVSVGCALPIAARAQATPVAPADASPVCLGFAFGAFNPRLDWAKAGHAPIRDSASLPHAPAGRDWASDQALPNDSSLYLFPSWWPVGVYIELSTRRPAPGDTASGRATALVASGRVTPPVARVKAWRVPCGGPDVPAPTADPAGTSVERPRPQQR